jgi:single-strand DNA-binding protein
MEITGRLTADAKINTLTDGREVTNFTIVINDRFSTKAGERRDVATYIKCAYWVSSKAAQHLKKGSIVSVYGRIGIEVYKTTEGEAQGSLTLHVNSIRFVASAPKKEAQTTTATPQHTSPETIDDLPF